MPKDESICLDRVAAKIERAVTAKHLEAEIVPAEKGDVDGTWSFAFKRKEGPKKWQVAFIPDGTFHSTEEPLNEANPIAKAKEAFAQK